MPGILNNVGMLIQTTGQGTITADTTISSRYHTPAEAGATSGRSYFWKLEDGNDFEFFIGTYSSSGPTITRDLVIQSKIAGVAGTTKLDLTGSAQLRSVAPREAFGPILLNTLTASNSATLSDTTSFNSLFDAYQIVLEDLLPATNSVNALFRMSTNAGSSWPSGGSDYGSGNTSADAIYLVNSTGTSISFPNAANDGDGFSGSLALTNVNSTSRFKKLSGVVADVQTNCFVGGSYVGATSAVNGLRFQFSSGNIASGVMRVYGMLK